MTKKASKPSKPTITPAPSAAKLDTSLCDALLKITGQPAPKKGETLKSLVERLCVGMADVKDDDYNALPQEARTWYETNFAAYNADQFDKLLALPGMPGYSQAVETKTPDAPKAEAPAPAASAEATTTPTSETKETTMAKGKGSKKATKATETKKADAKANGSGERKPRTDAMSYKVRQAVVANPDVGFEDVCKAVGAKGDAASPTGHIHNMFAHAKHVMTLAREHYSLRAK